MAICCHWLDSGEFIHCSELAEFLCEEWGFQDARGDLKRINPLDEIHWVNCLRENFTSSSYGEGLETGRASAHRTSPFPDKTGTACSSVPLFCFCTLGTAPLERVKASV